jgi:hypothetical protein
MLRDQVVVMLSARHLRRVKRAFKQARSTEMALVLPAQAANFVAVPGLETALAWAAEYEKDLTLIGGSAALRAEAVARGLRVATDVAAWTCWLADALVRAAKQESGAQARQGWHVIRPSAGAENDALPDFVAALGMTAGLAVGDSLAIPADECYENAVIATLWDTCDFTGSLPHISNG